MTKIEIILETAQRVKEFVNTVSRFPYGVGLHSGRHIVDAKSLLGIFTLDISKPVMMVVDTDNCHDLLAAVANYTVA